MTAPVSNTHKVLHGISSQTLVTIVLGVVEVLSFSIMSRLLTKADFGYYAAVMAVVNIYSCFTNTGIGSAVVQKKDLTQRYVDNAFTLSLLIGTFVSMILFVSSPFLAEGIADNTMVVPLMLMSVTLLFSSLISVNFSLMQRKLQFLQMGIINLMSLIITTVVAIILAWKGYGYYAIIIRAVLGSVITLCLSYIMAKTRYSFRLDGKTFREIFHFSGWLMASVLFRNIAHNIDKLLMPRLLSITLLGAYNRPKEFFGQISTKLNGIFDSVLFPVLSGIQSDKEKLAGAFKKSLYYINIFSMLLTLSCIVNNELIIRVFFGEQWLTLKEVTIVLSLILVFNIDARLADCFLRSLGLTRQQFFFRIAETITAIIGFFLGYRWGVMGVAVSVVSANSMMKILKILYVACLINVPVSQTIRIILNSWRFCLIMIPVCLVASLLVPGGMVGNIMLLVVFIIVCCYIFLFAPKLVGDVYKVTVHQVKKKYAPKVYMRS